MDDLWAKIEAVVADGYSGPKPVKPVADPNVDTILCGMEVAFEPELTQERLKEILDYNPETGVFTWKSRPLHNGGARVGDVAGSHSRYNAYILITIDERTYRGHQLAWLYVYGYFPEEIDHCDRDRTNNRIDNLFEVAGPKERSIQRYNSRISSRNTSGHRGVYWNTNARKWEARIGNGSGNSSEFLGSFSTIEEAVAVRRAAEIKKFGCLVEELKNPKNRQRQEDIMPSDDITQKDKLDALRNESLLKKGTYHSVASAELDQERGGRYATLNKPVVSGTGPAISYPRQPSTAPANQMAMVGIEAPLGYSVEDQEPCGQPFEIQRSIDALSANGGTPKADDARPRSTSGSGPSTFKRRI